MHLIAYMSQATFPAADREQVLGKIITTARTRNAEHNITGALVMLCDTFVQVLEGEHHALLALLERIKSDPRHSNVNVLIDSPIERRSFPQWSMELFVSSDAARDVAEHFTALVAAYRRETLPQADALVALVKMAIEHPALLASVKSKQR